MQTIEAGKVVAISLTVIDPANDKVLTRASEEAPLLYLHGHGNLTSDALEEALEGLAPGETFDVTLDDAYGPGLDGEPTAVPRRELPRDWPVETGFSFHADGSQGQRVQLFVHGVRGSRVLIGAQHPWGGKPIRFTGTVLDMRNATLEERQHGHAHGPGGHHH